MSFRHSPDTLGSRPAHAGWRRGASLAGAALLALAMACGGGGGGGISALPTPVISSFSNSGPVPYGGPAVLTAVFSGGTGVVNPGNLAITSGVGLSTGNLDASTLFTLTVTGAAGTAVSSTDVTITYTSAPGLEVQIPDVSSPGAMVPLELVSIPAGTFQMGAYAGEQDSNSVETPQHQVTLSQPFYMATFLTSQAQWRAVTGTNPSNFCTANEGSSTDDFTRPVEMVSWNSIHATGTGFLALLNTAVAAALPAGMAFSLPTEAQWECACRATTATRFYWGDDPGYTLINQYAWWSGNSSGSTHPVGSMGAGSANIFGLYDMGGNVFEWCADWYGPYAAGAQVDPAGPSSGTYRVVRGGAWYYGDTFCRSANRSYSGPNDSFSSIGFRVVLAPIGAQ